MIYKESENKDNKIEIRQVDFISEAKDIRFRSLKINEQTRFVVDNDVTVKVSLKIKVIFI
jgi:hypothetical protein